MVLFPDVAGWDKWYGKAQSLQESLGSAVLVSDWLERMANPAEREAGIDLADVLVKARRVEKDNLFAKNHLLKPIKAYNLLCFRCYIPKLPPMVWQKGIREKIEKVASMINLV